MSNTVEVPRWLVVGGGVMLLAAISTSAFLLGRTTAPGTTAATNAPPATVASAKPSDTGAVGGKRSASRSTPKAPHTAKRNPTPSTTSNAAAPQPASATAPVSKAAPATAQSSTSETNTAPKVAAYFANLERIDTSAPGGIDQNALVQQVLGGDVSGIDALIADHKRRLRAIEAVRPPPPCATHHAALVKLAVDGLALMEKLRTGIASGNLGSLMSLQPRSVQLQKLGDEVTQMEAELKNQYGLH